MPLPLFIIGILLEVAVIIGVVFLYFRNVKRIRAEQDEDQP